MNEFLFGCLADLFNAIANEHFWPHETYPGERLQCDWAFASARGTVTFELELAKVDAPNWDFTIADLGDDLGAIFHAAQLFIDPVSGIPQMNIDVFRYRNGKDGPTFLASQGSMKFVSSLATNVSVA